MTNKIIYTLLLIAISFVAYGQEKFTLSGTIAIKENTETIIGASIYIPEANVSAVTNSYGFYSITLPKGEYTLVISYVGFETIEEHLSLTGNIKKDFSMFAKSTELDAVVISVNHSRTNIRKPEMSVNRLSINTIKKMPAIMGEVDILKAILQLPGVCNAQEGATGFNVRGGSVDGNLVLLDEAVVYNTSHLFGFFSVFNADVIKDLKLYKGGIPANFGGRTSSVLDIYQKEGNNQEYHVTGGIGAVASRLLVEGPLVKDKSSFVVAGRASYAHLFLKLADNANSVSFYDLNAKLNHKINDNNRIFLSGYFGKDQMDFGNFFSNNYGNSFLNLRWNHTFSEKLFSNASVIYSKYDYGLKIKYVGIDWVSDINNYNFKYNFTHNLSDKIILNYGINSIYYQFNPGTIKPMDFTSSINPDQIEEKYAWENALYISAEQKLSDKISLTYGLRYSNFQRLGEQNVNTYANNQAVVYNPELKIYEAGTPTGTIHYNKNERIIDFGNFEPRLAVSYVINDNQSVKASYNRMSQYIHLISNTASVSPLDIWAPSDQYLKPEILDQVALGYFRNFGNGNYSLEAETFYKRIKNKTDYIDGAELIANKAIEEVMLNGEGRSCGLELMLKKNTGKLTGWLSYTLSRAEQRTPGRNAYESGINNGEWYRANYDKTHNFSLTGAYQLNKKWNFGGVFTYQTGKATTYPIGKYLYQGITIANYGERNINSLPAYHHLDLSATYTPKPDSKKRWKSEWVFSIYNVYNRGNAATLMFEQNRDTGISEAKKISIFGIIPGVSYNFRF
ncbi:collagen-binding protein [Flavobacterium akiainvivens]|uniref:Collagen-binding protein n=1 Tax=Flavobacterium akiainvivens TaxID=1202724 RepID=A0A0M8M7Y0_9FLAO|nr:TonB-dependent receptor [Flavobacterium akiainvivens]KOS05313.1 collagen-binding protein [Flavobacterium akiainvivens]SFQ76392.1 TonB-dependent Receptor Plug Domain [Flavobacterium akiainvivens]